MSLTIRRLLLATSALMGLFTGNVGVTKPRAIHLPAEPQGWYSRRGYRQQRRYPYSGQREERRALLRLEFKLENGRWP